MSTSSTSEPSEPEPGREDQALPEGPDQPGRRSRSVSPRSVIAVLAVLGAFMVGVGAVVAFTDSPADPIVLGSEDGVARIDEDRPAPDARSPLPDAVLEGHAEGEPDVVIADYRGRPLVLNFWASWCAPCVAEMPEFQEAWEGFAADVAMLGVNVQDARSNATAFAEELGITYDLARDPQGAFFTDVQGFGMPTTLLVDRDGQIVFRHTGILDREGLEELVAEHLHRP